MQQEGGVRPSLYHSNYINDTRSECVCFVDWHSLPSSSKGSPLTQFTRKEAVLLSHDIYLHRLNWMLWDNVGLLH